MRTARRLMREFPTHQPHHQPSGLWPSPVVLSPKAYASLAAFIPPSRVSPLPTVLIINPNSPTARRDHNHHMLVLRIDHYTTPSPCLLRPLQSRAVSASRYSFCRVRSCLPSLPARPSAARRRTPSPFSPSCICHQPRLILQHAIHHRFAILPKWTPRVFPRSACLRMVTSPSQSRFNYTSHSLLRYFSHGVQYTLSTA